jgi:hypothetical protein
VARARAMAEAVTVDEYAELRGAFEKDPARLRKY